MENVELDVQQKDKEGLSPVALAEKKGHRKCADYLKIAVSKVHFVFITDNIAWLHNCYVQYFPLIYYMYLTYIPAKGKIW